MHRPRKAQRMPSTALLKSKHTEGGSSFGHAALPHCDPIKPYAACELYGTGDDPFRGLLASSYFGHRPL